MSKQTRWMGFEDAKKRAEAEKAKKKTVKKPSKKK